MTPTRRQLLTSAGATALVATVGSQLFGELGLALPRFSGEDLDLGDLNPLADLFEELSPDALMPRLVAEWRKGTSLAQLTAAGALANARSLGGEDYEGYHAFMGMVPALMIAGELPANEAPLPVLKTLKRSAVRMHKVGGGTLSEVSPEAGDPRKAIRNQDLARAERALAAAGAGGTEAAWKALHPVIVDDIEVHLVVFAWRSKEIAMIAGPDHAVTSMRQILHFADGREARRRRDGKPEPAVRDAVATQLEEHGLLAGKLGSKDPGDAAVSELAEICVTSSRHDATAAMGAFLGAGNDPRAAAEALRLASTRLLLRDPGRSKAHSGPGKPPGSVHGASIGVHASDSALAWSEIAASVDGAATASTLLAGAFHTAGQSGYVGRESYGYAAHLEEAAKVEAGKLVGALREAATGGDQPRAGAIAQRMSELGQAEALFDALRMVAVSQDGALHAEKYQHTSRVAHAASREAFRPEHLVAYARVVASQACLQSPEVAEVRELIG